MVVLKKIRSATLVEVLVATALIVIVFMIASLILNNLLLNTFSKNTHPIENKLNEVEYLFQNNMLRMPYREEWQSWTISIEPEVEKDKWYRINAVNTTNSKVITRKSCHVE